ncbi:MAG TPA: aldo/keto reductase [Anaerolineae bacterium]|nr:aldo/keto reductase [Anaerolineae bacterium]
MERRKLGNSELSVTPIGIGTWAIGGGDNPYGWGSQDDKDSIAAIRRGLELGVNWIDTAAGYGHGHSEEVIGQAIAGRRDEVIIATKCGILWQEDGSDIFGCMEAASIKREVENSLRRLKVDVIDLWQIHWPLPDEGIEEGWGAVADVIKEGKVRYGGVSNFSVEQLKRIMPIHPVTSLQPPFSMLLRDTEKELLPFCAENDIGVVVYSPMQAGLLTGKMTRERVAAFPEDDWRKGNSLFQEPQLSINLDLVEKVRPIAQRAGRPVSQLAIAWVLRRPEVTSAIVGARRPSQIEETAGAAEWKLSAEEIAEIDKLLAEREEALAELA